VETFSPQAGDLALKSGRCVPQVAHQPCILDRQSNRWSQRFKKLEIGFLKGAFNAVDDLDHPEDTVSPAKRRADQVPGALPRSLVDPRVEKLVVGNIVDPHGLARSHHSPGDSLGNGKAQGPETAVNAFLGAAGHRKIKLVTGLIDQQKRAPFAVQHLLGVADDQGEKVVEVVLGRETARQFQQNR
jgi:hypothetical protein